MGIQATTRRALRSGRRRARRGALWPCLLPFALLGGSASPAAEPQSRAAAEPPGRAAAEPSGRAIDATALTFTVEPARIVLGETTEARLTLSARLPSGAPLDVAPPELTASTGALSPPTRTAPGVWTFTFTPPKEAFPHVAIVAASIDTAATSAVGFVPLRLWGKGETAVRTKPNSEVTVFIGNDSHGPVRADPSGLAKVPLVVPPGPERAVARSVDELGNESQKTIDLAVPAFNRVALVALDDPVPADGSGRARVLAFLVDKKGEPLFTAKLVPSASVGTFAGEPLGVAPGIFLFTWLPGKAPPGNAELKVALDGAAGSLGKASLKLIRGGPARATLELSRAALSADDERVVQVLLRLFDGADSPVSARAASVDVDYGRIDATFMLPDGTRRIQWLIPPETLRERATLTARLPSGSVLGTAEVALSAGRPARAFFDDTGVVIADGASSVELVLHVSDRAGNELVPVGAHIEVDPAAGQIVGATLEGKTFKARFVPVVSEHPDFVRVRGVVGAVATETLVHTAPRPSAWLLVGPGVAVGSNYGSILSVGPDLSLLARLPVLDGSLHAGLSLSVLQSVTRPAGVLDQRAYPVWAELAWRPPLSPELGFHLGGAAGVVLGDLTVTGPQGDQRVVEPAVAGQLVLGVTWRLGPGVVELDGRAGTSRAVGGTVGENRVGLPLGAAVVTSYRFGL